MAQQRWALGGFNMVPSIQPLLAARAASSGWTSNRWLTHTQAVYVHPGPVRLRRNAEPLEVVTSQADVAACIPLADRERSGGKVLPLVMLPPRISHDLLEQFVMPTTGWHSAPLLRREFGDKGASRTPMLLCHTPTPDQPQHCTWTTLTPAEALLASIAEDHHPTRHPHFVAHTALQQLQLPQLPPGHVQALVHALDRPAVLQLFNAQQTENACALDFDLVPRNAGSPGRPLWNPTVGQKLLFLGAQMKYESALWVDLPNGPTKGLPGCTIKPDLQPHRVTFEVSTRFYHITAFSLPEQHRLVQSMPSRLTEGRHVVAVMVLGGWTRQGRLSCFKRLADLSASQPHGLTEAELQHLRRITSGSVLIAAEDVARLGLTLPRGVHKFSVVEKLSFARYFVNRDQIVDPSSCFDHIAPPGLSTVSSVPEQKSSSAELAA
jgi:hypothetical protein